MNTAIITAAGCGTRSELKINKNLFFFNGSTVIEKTVTAFLSVKKIDRIIVTAAPKDIKKFERILVPMSKKITVIEGGETRTESVKKALDICEDGFVLIHDGARPFVTPALIKNCLLTAVKFGSAIPALPLTETAGVIENDTIIKTQRNNLLSLQTPQVFEVKQIKSAYKSILPQDEFTDDCGVYCRYIAPCRFVKGERSNIKLTHKKDFENLLPSKTGVGFDIHTLKEQRKLVLGGVNIPYDKGLSGHSDADALIHAIMDAMLSAAGLKDIGHYFPPTDDKFKDISSLILLKKVVSLVKKQGYKPVSLSFVIMAEKPKLSPYMDKIIDSLSKNLKIKRHNIGGSATTMEGIGIVGREEGIACSCVVNLAASLS